MYHERFEDLLAVAERHARKHGRASHRRLTTFTGRRLVALATEIAISGETPRGACQRLDIHSYPTTSILKQVGWGLDRLELLDRFRSEVHGLVGWLASAQSPDYEWRERALMNHMDQLVEQVTETGMSEPEGRLWLVENWACSDRRTHQLPRNGKTPAPFPHNMSTGFDRELDRLVADTDRA